MSGQLEKTVKNILNYRDFAEKGNNAVLGRVLMILNQ